MKIRWYGRLFIIGIMFLLSACQNDSKIDHSPFTLSIDEHVFLELSPNIPLPSHKETIEKIHAVDEIYSFELEEGSFTITKRIIEEDTMLFFEAIQIGERPLHIPYTIKTATKDYTFHPFANPIVEEHHDVFGIDYTTNVKGYVQSDAGDWMISQNYRSVPKVMEYDDGTTSTVRHLVEEDDRLTIEMNNDELQFQQTIETSYADEHNEQWFMFSSSSLFETDLWEEYRDETNEEFLRSAKWVTPTGIYTKLPWSIEPATKLGYGRNPQLMQGQQFLDYYERAQERFFYNMIVHSVNVLMDYKGGASTFYTEYTSTWLKKEYGITAPYTDTRHNELISLFLTNVRPYIQEEALESIHLLYADFLVEQAEQQNTLPTKNGFYILDYFSPTQTKPTHVSLNHALGELHYVLQAYEASGDERYLHIGTMMKNAVEDSGTDWIDEETGDLFYRIAADYSYGGTDYEQLTLRDLLTAVEDFRRLDIPYDHVFYTLIHQKRQFLEQQQLPLKEDIQEKIEALHL